MFSWKGKRVLVTGSKGMIGTVLEKMLIEKGAKVFGIDKNLGVDLTSSLMCELMIQTTRPDYIFHLAGIKGNPKMTKERPVDFMCPMLQFDTNMILYSQLYNVKRFLYTSSIAVENMKSDFYPAWAKMTAENLIKAMRVQYPEGTKYCIVRPANVYGSEDLHKDNLMVVSSLIKSGLKNSKLILDKKGSTQIRDIIHARDVARGMIKAMEELPKEPVNLCSGKGTSIKEIAEYIAEELDIYIEYKNLNLVLGPQKKVMKKPYIKPIVKLKDGIKEVCHDCRNTSL